jgi:hypothetical protein
VHLFLLPRAFSFFVSYFLPNGSLCFQAQAGLGPRGPATSSRAATMRVVRELNREYFMDF